MPEIAIIIPVHNGEETIEEAIESVLGQSFDDFELLLMDHNSTDGTAEICEEYVRRDLRVRHVKVCECGGAGIPRNRGIKLAHSPYITFLDADDQMMPNALKVLHDGITLKNADICIGGFRTYVQDLDRRYEKEYILVKHFYGGRQKARSFFAEYYPDMILGVPWNKLYRKSVIEKYGIYFPGMRRLEDGIFNLRYFDRVDSVQVVSDIVNLHMESAQVEKGKLGKHFFDEMRHFVISYYRYLRRWGLASERYEQKIADYYHNDLISLLEKMVLDGNGSDRKIRKIREDSISRKMLSIPCLSGRYTKIAIYLLKSGRYASLRFFIKIKLKSKAHMPRFFYGFRKLVNG